MMPRQTCADASYLLLLSPINFDRLSERFTYIVFEISPPRKVDLGRMKPPGTERLLFAILTLAIALQSPSSFATSRRIYPPASPDSIATYNRKAISEGDQGNYLINGKEYQHGEVVKLFEADPYEEISTRAKKVERWNGVAFMGFYLFMTTLTIGLVGLTYPDDQEHHWMKSSALWGLCAAGGGLMALGGLRSKALMREAIDIHNSRIADKAVSVSFQLSF